MGGDSRRSFRIKGLRNDLEKEDFLKTIKDLNSMLPDRYRDCQPHGSLAVYKIPETGEPSKCSTISCRSKYHKDRLIKKVVHCQDWNPEMAQASCSVTFEGMTVLHAPSEPQIDICVLHGLNGHAIDTFERRLDEARLGKATQPWRMRLDTTTHKLRRAGKAAFRRGQVNKDPSAQPNQWHASETANGNGNITGESTEHKNDRRPMKEPCSMWPRDFLARDNDFKNARIMTFDYDAKLNDTHNLSELKSWSSDLLRDMNSFRSNCPERPIIFIGYSMGGIVIRQAAVDLWKGRSTNKIPNVSLKHCGFMFLGTPHYGSQLADTGKMANVLLDLSGYRKEMLGPMRSGHECIREHDSVWTEFFKSKDVGDRPIVCFSEARSSKILRGLVHAVIVKQQNARWMDVDAEEIAGTDHHTICTYSSANDNGYEIIVQRLGEIRRELLSKHNETHRGGTDTPATKQGPEEASRQQHSVAVSCPQQDISTEGRQKSLLHDHKSENGAPKPLTYCEDSTWTGEQPTSLSQARATTRKVEPRVDGSILRKCFSSASTFSALQVQTANELKPWFMQQTISSPAFDSSYDMHVWMYGGAIQSIQSTAGGKGLLLKDSLLPFTPFTPLTPFTPATHTTPSSNILTDSSPEMTERFPSEVIDAWEEQSSLSLDAGGLRGYSALLVLKMLMARISQIECEDDSSWKHDDRPWKDKSPTISISRRSSSHSSHSFERVMGSLRRQSTSSMRDEKQYVEVYLPCHYFDYISGISSGGIIAIMLGRLRMSVQDCIESYQLLSKKSFEIPRHSLSAKRLRTLDRGSHLDNVIKTTLLHNGDLKLEASPELCKTSVIAYDASEQRCRVFRSYDNESLFYSATPLPRFRPLSPGLADTCKVKQAMRAISAAPPYFEPVAISQKKYMDASTILANSTRESINEVLNRAGNKPQTLKCLVSIGCGQPNQEYYSSFKQLSSKNSLKAMTLDSQNAHEQAGTFSRLHDTPYFRFEVKGKTWKQSHTKSGDQSLYTQLEQEVNDYFDTKQAKQLLEDCAQDLVARRRLRAKDHDKWSKFTGVKL